MKAIQTIIVIVALSIFGAACQDASSYSYGSRSSYDNYDKGQKELGTALSYDGGRDGVKKDQREAVKWYHKAAEKGSALAQRKLGELYTNGYANGNYVYRVKEDKREAAKWYREAAKSFRRAAERGDEYAQLTLGEMYIEGEGVEKDYREAAKWYHKAVEQDNGEAQLYLGNMYIQGNGVPQDYIEAYILLSLAEENAPYSLFAKRARKDKNLVANRLTATEIRDANKEVKRRLSWWLNNIFYVLLGSCVGLVICASILFQSGAQKIMGAKDKKEAE